MFGVGATWVLSLECIREKYSKAFSRLLLKYIAVLLFNNYTITFEIEIIGFFLQRISVCWIGHSQIWRTFLQSILHIYLSGIQFVNLYGFVSRLVSDIFTIWTCKFFSSLALETSILWRKYQVSHPVFLGVFLS